MKKYFEGDAIDTIHGTGEVIKVNKYCEGYYHVVLDEKPEGWKDEDFFFDDMSISIIAGPNNIIEEGKNG